MHYTRQVALSTALALAIAGCGHITTPVTGLEGAPALPIGAAPTASMPGMAMPAGGGPVVSPAASPAATALPAGALPPLEVRKGNVVDVTLVAQETTVGIADGETYPAWTFDGQVPGPVIRLQQGDTVHVTFINDDPRMAHSLDLHAAATAPSVNFVPVMPGKSTSFTFTADHAGVFLYHCGTPPMVEHIANGMFGAVIVDPQGGRVDAQEYVLIQSEWYNGPLDLTDMEDGQAKYVVFNGVENQYADHPLPVDTDKLLRLYVLNAGPDHFSSFHVVGAVFDTVEPSGSPEAALHGLQAWTVGPGDAAMFELRLSQAGNYPFVTHAMDDMAKGAMGTFAAGAAAVAGTLLPSAAVPRAGA